jgi:hypothetical protein
VEEQVRRNPKTVAAERAAEWAPGVYVNPGAGPITHGTLAQDATTNMHALLADVGLDGATFEGGEPDVTGRFSFVVSYADRRCEVRMPGTTLEEVRYVRLPGQDIWNFPRLYVDGSSWSWVFAVDEIRDALADECEG